jgi:hypothetical protein
MKIFIDYCRECRIPKKAVIAALWELLPMPIAEEIELHVTEIGSLNENKRNGDAKKRRINK